MSCASASASVRSSSSCQHAGQRCGRSAPLRWCGSGGCGNGRRALARRPGSWPPAAGRRANGPPGRGRAGRHCGTDVAAPGTPARGFAPPETAGGQHDRTRPAIWAAVRRKLLERRLAHRPWPVCAADPAACAPRRASVEPMKRGQRDGGLLLGDEDRGMGHQVPQQLFALVVAGRRRNRSAPARAWPARRNRSSPFSATSWKLFAASASLPWSAWMRADVVFGDLAFVAARSTCSATSVNAFSATWSLASWRGKIDGSVRESGGTDGSFLHLDGLRQRRLARRLLVARVHR